MTGSNGGDTAVSTEDPVAEEATRRRLTPRQAEVVQQLVDAAIIEVEEEGSAGLSIRNVARRAGVAPATAYTYFSSKEHLLAEVLWRRIHSLPPVRPSADRSTPPWARLAETVRELGQSTTESPALVAACTPALLSQSPDVKHLRDRIGAEIHRRLAAAMGKDTDPVVVQVLETTYFGALLAAGMGHMAFTEVPDFVATAARLLSGKTVPEEPMSRGAESRHPKKIVAGARS